MSSFKKSIMASINTCPSFTTELMFIWHILSIWLYIIYTPKKLSFAAILPHFISSSERVSKTGVTGTLLSEAKYINVSLHFLEQVCNKNMDAKDATFL